MQVVDDDKGPSTKREYEIARVPAGEGVTGKVIDFLGRLPLSQVQLGTDVMVPLFGEQPDMESREQIAESLLTGVKVRHATDLENDTPCSASLHYPPAPAK